MAQNLGINAQSLNDLIAERDEIVREMDAATSEYSVFRLVSLLLSYVSIKDIDTSLCLMVGRNRFKIVNQFERGTVERRHMAAYQIADYFNGLPRLFIISTLTSWHGVDELREMLPRIRQGIGNEVLLT
jgi:hypothetical protein